MKTKGTELGSGLPVKVSPNLTGSTCTVSHAALKFSFKSCASTDFATGALGKSHTNTFCDCHRNKFCSLTFIDPSLLLQTVNFIDFFVRVPCIAEPVSLENSVPSYQKFIIAVAPLALPLFVTKSLINAGFEQILMNFRAGEPLPFGGVEILPLILVSYFVPLFILTLLILQANNKRSFAETFSVFTQVIAEDLRVWTKIIGWGLLFIIPGIIQAVRLVFVPWVVALSSLYQTNQVDALKVSWFMTKGRPQFLIRSVLAVGILPSLPELLNESPLGDIVWYRFGVAPFISFLLAAFGVQFANRLYLQLSKNKLEQGAQTE